MSLLCWLHGVVLSSKAPFLIWGMERGVVSSVVKKKKKPAWKVCIKPENTCKTSNLYTKFCVIQRIQLTWVFMSNLFLVITGIIKAEVRKYSPVFNTSSLCFHLHTGILLPAEKISNFKKKVEEEMKILLGEC